MPATQQRPTSWNVLARPVEVDEAAARRALRTQVARLERELARTVARLRPRDGIDLRTEAHGGPRLLGLGELERLRDELAARLGDAQKTLAARARREAEMREQLREMLLQPGHHHFRRITQADVGQPGCGAWHVRPRLGLIGMLMGWWQVKVSSGCPLPVA